MKKRPSILICLLTLLVSCLFASCGWFNSTPKVTLTATNCKVADISIAFENTIVLKDPGTPWVVQTVVVVTCSGEPVPDAEVMVEFPWLSLVDPYTLKTGTDGKLTVKKDNIGSDPTGKSIDITVKGSDGEKTETLTIPAAQ